METLEIIPLYNIIVNDTQFGQTYDRNFETNQMHQSEKRTDYSEEIDIVESNNEIAEPLEPIDINTGKSSDYSKVTDIVESNNEIAKPLEPLLEPIDTNTGKSSDYSKVTDIVESNNEIIEPLEPLLEPIDTNTEKKSGYSKVNNIVESNNRIVGPSESIDTNKEIINRRTPPSEETHESIMEEYVNNANTETNKVVASHQMEDPFSVHLFYPKPMNKSQEKRENSGVQRPGESSGEYYERKEKEKQKKIDQAKLKMKQREARKDLKGKDDDDKNIGCDYCPVGFI